ncbi:lyase family protein [Subtercola boreus]|uniref:Fumarate lyase N-terminal domain-containing protein n=1 Tax=Subtercola boreus TaxID=120213 RepID=A0A3E0WAW1_9MICO|nr:lyase family protein [Subtercola boreus]RFA19357.1 hypothetical protein B7R24_11970 [Subtercola boreus]RFA19618.1 hypothetical protein B7R23_11950 [Subtercola boreus]RFA25984.1 hypothetical protein B7R25_12070 [Subtercola boreus]
MPEAAAAGLSAGRAGSQAPAGAKQTSFRYTDLLDPLGADGSASHLIGDEAWLAALVRAEVALSRALVSAGVAPTWMLAVTDTVGEPGVVDPGAIAVAARAGGNPVIPLVARLSALAEERHPGSAEFVHVGATSQDMVDSAAMFLAARVLDRVTDDLRQLGSALTVLAEQHRRTPQAGRTLGQHAAPTTFGFVVAGWLDAVCTVIEQATDARQRLPASLSGAVGTLAVLTQVVSGSAEAGGERSGEHPDASETVDAVVTAFAAELGLAAPALSWHTNRLPVAEVGSVLAAVTGVMGSIASQVAELSRTEIGELSEGLAAGEGGSSAMPHKRNPVASVLIVAGAKQAPGLVSTLYGSLIAEDQRAIGGWHAEWQTLRQLERIALECVGAAVPLVSNLHVDETRMRSNLDLTHGLLYSERLSAALAQHLGRAEAFALVRGASGDVSAGLSPGLSLADALDARLASVGHTADGAVRAAVREGSNPDAGHDHTAAGIDRVLARFAALAAPGDHS